ncbi:MAG TPA: hypothetical protein VET89_07510 [Stellaceae bacterium]|nr:hypothetical protein [Stellaceae bacterium]
MQSGTPRNATGNATGIGTGIAIGFAAVVVAVLVIVSVGNWERVGDTGISVNGWIALVLGVIATLVVGGGLMALIFISNRRGYDEPPGGGR